MNENPEKQVFDSVKVWVPILIALLSVAVTWGVFSTKLSQAEQNIDSLQSTQQQTANALGAIQIQVGEINTSVQFIEKQYQN